MKWTLIKKLTVDITIVKKCANDVFQFKFNNLSENIRNIYLIQSNVSRHSGNRNGFSVVARIHSMVMSAQLVSRDDGVAEEAAGRILTHNMHVFITQSKLDLWGCCPVTHLRHGFVHSGRIHAE